MRHALLDPLRGLAALWVVGYHLACFAGEESPLGPRFFALGYFGVPMFFVISGYCLTAAARRALLTGQPPLPFLLRRMARIYPPLWAAILVAVAVYALGPASWSRYTAAGWPSYSAADWLGVGLLTKTFQPTGELPWHKFQPVNVAFWTLAIEVQFYLVVSLALFSGRWFYRTLIALTVVTSPFLLSPTAYVHAGFLPHWPFFALGMAVVAAREANVATVRSAWVPAVAAMAFGLWQAPAVPDGSSKMVAAEFLFAVGFALAVWLSSSFPLPRLLQPLTFLGTISYSVYLLHVPLLMAGMDWAARVAEFGGVPWAVLVVGGVCAASVPFHYLFERPFVSARRRPAPLAVP
ncbi:acyltransferase family protein [Limnoglobus roseus]|uniref:Acyltransferase n=1 Tax=Limnoglobus roseus TaxID=2598579 RepID=A0A5C1A7E5_9BACT|nr:acyltransferase [Limnoglobus roseus]QEL15199.1 acyltransferase [Limnoglobus roseus]